MVATVNGFLTVATNSLNLNVPGVFSCSQFGSGAIPQRDRSRDKTDDTIRAMTQQEKRTKEAKIRATGKKKDQSNRRILLVLWQAQWYATG